MSKYKIDHVKITLFLSLVFIPLVPNIKHLHDHAYDAMVLFLILMGVIAYFYRARFDVKLIGILAASFIIARLIFNKVDEFTFTFRMSGTLAFVLLNFALCIGPWSRFSQRFLTFYKHRRHIGVTAFLFALTHASFIFKEYFQYSVQNAYQAVFIFFGSTALFVMGILAVTSWDYLQKHVPPLWWKLTHFGLLLAYIGSMIYFLSVTPEPLALWKKVLLGSFLGYWIIVAPWSFSQTFLRFVNGWKQLHVLIYVAYVSAVVHVWTGVVIEQARFVQGAFWGMIGVVALSHIVGWAYMLREYVKRLQITYKHKTIVLDGGLYYQLDRVDSFIPLEGRLFDMQNIPLAVFAHQGKVLAYSNRCKHQGGPLYKGKIRKGYLECPWHRWQYSVTEGCGPPGFEDCVPFYPVAIQDGMAYVGLMPINKGRLNGEYQKLELPRYAKGLRQEPIKTPITEPLDITSP